MLRNIQLPLCMIERIRNFLNPVDLISGLGGIYEKKFCKTDCKYMYVVCWY